MPNSDRHHIVLTIAQGKHVCSHLSTTKGFGSSAGHCCVETGYAKGVVDAGMEGQRYNGLVNKITQLDRERTAALRKQNPDRIPEKHENNLLLRSGCENPPLTEPAGLTGEILSNLIKQVQDLSRKVEELKSLPKPAEPRETTPERSE